MKLLTDMKHLKLFFFLFTLISCSKSLKDSNFPSYELKNSFQHEVYGEVAEFSHKKSGASLVLIKNKDKARSFAAGFRTPPYDNTGVFHIFEHAVLAGSRLYPSKSNFFNLSDSSIASFLNAATSSVYTYYPFTTKNTKEFHNLLSVYMDAVFFPNTTKDPNLVKREGWRYEVDEEGKLGYNGIVFSEMKGRLAKPSLLLYLYLNKLLLPSTPYKYESGGRPENVVDLKFEQIIEAHKEYYHPQNSLISLYGDLDFKKALKSMDEMFLSHFEKDPSFKPKKIPFQKSLSKKTVKKTYPGPPIKKSDYIASGYVLGEKSLEDSYTSYLLLFALTNQTSSPLKLEILNQNLAKDVSISLLYSEDNAFAFVFKGTEEEHLEKIKEILNRQIAKAGKEGLDSKLLNSVLNSWEFDEKEKKNHAHKGQSLFDYSMSNFIYPRYSLQKILDYKSLFKKIRENLEDKEYAKNFFKSLLKNERNRFLIMKADPEHSNKFNQILQNKLDLALKEKSIEEFKKEDDEFKDWNASKESPEILSKTPILDLKDIKASDKPTPFKKSNLNSSELIEYPQKTHGISYLQLFFDLKGVKKENIKNLRLLETLLQKTDSKDHNFKDLSQDIKTYFGNLSFYSNPYSSYKNPKEFKALLEVSFSFLNENEEKVFSLLEELLKDRPFTPLSQIEATWNEKKSRLLNGLSSLAPYFATNSIGKHFFHSLSRFTDELGRSSQAKYILKSEFQGDKLQSEMKEIFKRVFNKNRLKLITITSDKKQITSLKPRLKAFMEALPNETFQDQDWDFSDKHYEAFIIPGEVQYNYAGVLFKDLPYQGSFRVYSQYLDNQFLYPKLREQGGAYGAWSQVSSSGLFLLGTYKDPNLKSSFDAFKDIPSFMKDQDLKKENLRPSIIGALRPYYRDKSIEGKTNFMTRLYLRNMTWKDLVKLKKEILTTKKEDMDQITISLEKALPHAKKSVSGNKMKIKKEAPYLKEILELP